MIISNEIVAKRLSSSSNLMNKLNTIRSASKQNNSAMKLFMPESSTRSRKVESKVFAFDPFGPKSKQQLSSESDASIELGELPELDKNPTVEEKVIIRRQASPESPRIEDLVSNSVEQVKLGLAHDTALRILQESMETLHTKLDEIKPDRLSTVISVTSKVVESIRNERLAVAKGQGKDKEVHYHFYTPEQKKISDYEIIDLVSSPE